MVWFRCILVAWGVVGAPVIAGAQATSISAEMPSFHAQINGQEVTILRHEAVALDDSAVSNTCPPFCLQPMTPVEGVIALGEVEVLAFLAERVVAGQGILLDARRPERFAAGAIAAAVNVPAETLAAENPLRGDILIAMGAKALGGESFDFAEAPEVVVLGEGAASPEAVLALNGLRGAGYPVEKLRYYRGGMQAWRLMGLDVVQAKPQVQP